MAVLVEANSVIVKIDAIIERYGGGIDAFERCSPNATLCTDGDLARFGFMSPPEVDIYIQQLETMGLDFLLDGVPQDIVIVNQLDGPTTECNWIEVARIKYDEDQIVTAARMVGTASDSLWTPDGWQFEGSLSDKYVYLPQSEVNEVMNYLRTEGGVDTYRHRETGKLFYRGRTIPIDRH